MLVPYDIQSRTIAYEPTRPYGFVTARGDLPITYMDDPATAATLIERERAILARIAVGGPLDEVLRDLILLVEAPSNGDMLASILFVSPDGRRLLEGAAPSLPREYNDAIHGIEIGPNVGSCGTSAFRGEP